MECGVLLIAGGAINSAESSIFNKFIEAANKSTAKSSDRKTAKFAVFSADNGGAYTQRVLELLPKDTVVFDGNIDDLDGVTGCWLTDGSKRALIKAFADAEVARRVKRIYENGGVVGGSSAGAAVMSNVMIAGGTSRSALYEIASWGYDDYSPETSDRLRITKGAGIFPVGVIDRHFDAKCRFFRLVEAVVLTRDKRGGVGFGISEDTALLYDGKTGGFSIIGEREVYIVDCSAATRLGVLGEYTYTGIKVGVMNEKDSYFSHDMVINAVNGITKSVDNYEKRYSKTSDPRYAMLDMMPIK